MQPGKVRRVAIVAFVGDGARAFLPRPKGVEIICWPKAGGTNPDELRKLKQMGARIRFVDGLHMKVYWTSGRGAVITSANLSTNALGSGGLKEIGVILPAGALDIDEIITSLKSRCFNREDMQRLEKATKKLPPQFWPPPTENNFLEWYSQPEPAPWKLGMWTEYGDSAKKAKEIMQTKYNKKEPEDFISCRKKDYERLDWILSFRLSKKGAISPDWIFVDFVVKVGKREKAHDADYPYQAVQGWSKKHYQPPPFKITKSFRAALQNASRKFGSKSLENMRSTKPPGKLLHMIALEMKKGRW